MENYTLCEVLGRGADGKVSRAIRKLDNQPVCIKQIPQDKGPYQQGSGRNEVGAYQKLSHPNIPTFFEHFTEKNTLNVVIELADGWPLRNIIYTHATRKDPIPEERILQFLGQMVSLLLYFKRLALVYCDIKPENIIVDANWNIKLIDYGTARPVITKLKKQFSFGGTLAYLSPEMITNAGYAFETDVWSLGVVLYEMMTLELPFGSKPEKEVISKIQTAEPADIKGAYSAPLKSLVKQMLRKRPNSRISIEAISKLDFIPPVSEELTPDQWNCIGIKLRFGLGVKANMDKARRYFKMAADAGHQEGMLNYCFSMMNTDRRGDALQYLKQAADSGNPDAIMNYAVSQDQGWSGQRNPREAMRYYKLAADQGNSDAMCHYAIACTEGWDGRPDLEKALKYYRSAADAANAYGMLNYANARANGLNGKTDHQEAMKWYQAAADAGNVDAMLACAAGLTRGWKGKPDQAGAMKFFKMAADAGNASAMYSYAVGLEQGHLGAPDIAAAVKQYQAAAEAGHQEAKAAWARLTNGVALSKLPSLHPASPAAKR